MKHGEIITEGTQYLHALAPMLLLNTIGIACVKYGRFKELNNILKLSVPAGNFMGIYREPLLFLLGGTHWNNEIWTVLMGASYYYPFSSFFLWQLEPVFKDYFITQSEYENVFYMWEHLKSLMYGYNKCYLIKFSVPMGHFLLHRNKDKMGYKEVEPYTLFFEEADKLKNNWEPIKQGMFGGSYDNYKQIHEQAEAYYQQYRKY